VRSLNPDEALLWARVAATIRPLSRTPLPPEPAQHKISPKQPVRHVVEERLKAPPTIGAGTLDGTWDKRLKSGSLTPDRTLDLHGMSLDTAWQAIDRALEQGISAGDRVLLLITGHHRPGEPPVARGKIRAAVHDWLAHSRHASSIAAVRGAHRRHGGGGSLYIILRRR
jgi:DNA-nicking Smr family endonuclease